MRVDYKDLGLTSWHLLHEDLDEAVLADGAEVLHDVLVLEVFMQSNFFMQRLRISTNTQPLYVPSDKLWLRDCMHFSYPQKHS